jgi:hypothetical protein
MKRRIKHNDLTAWFLEDHATLPASYVKSCQEFFDEISKRQASSDKPQASSDKLQAMQGSSCKQQASSYSKRGWFESFINFQGASGKRQAPSSKHQAASHELLAL